MDTPSYSLIDYYLVLYKRKWFIALIVALSTAAAIFLSGRMPKIYEAKCSIMPLGQSSATAGIAAQLSMFTGMVGGIGGLQVPGKKLQSVLTSRTLAERILKEHPDLITQIYHGKGTPNPVDLAIMLSDKLKVEDVMKYGSLVLSMQDEDPKAAARILELYLAESADFLAENEFDEAKRNRGFIEKSLITNRSDFIESGIILANYYQKNAISASGATVDVNLSKDLRSLGNPSGKKVPPQDTILNSVPQKIYFEYLAAHHEILGKLNAVLTQQYHIAKIEEAKESLSFTVIDPPLIPTSKIKPRRTLIVAAALAGSLFFASFFVFVMEYYHSVKAALRQMKSAPPAVSGM